MMYFWIALRRAMNEGSGIKTSGIIAGWALVLYLIAHGPVARMVNEHTSMRPIAEKIKQVAQNRPVYKYGEIREDLVYYMDGKIKKIYSDPTELFQESNPLLLIRKTYEPLWFKGFQGNKKVLEMDAAFETFM